MGFRQTFRNDSEERLSVCNAKKVRPQMGSHLFRPAMQGGEEFY